MHLNHPGEVRERWPQVLYGIPLPGQLAASQGGACRQRGSAVAKRGRVIPPPLRSVERCRCDQGVAVSVEPESLEMTISFRPFGPLRLAVVPWALVLTFSVGSHPREV